MKKIAAMCLLLLVSVLLFVSLAATRQSDAAPASVDLSVTKVDSQDPVNTGSNLSYTITVTNGGPDAAANASWTDTLPVGTTFVSLSSVGGWSCTLPEAGDIGGFVLEPFVRRRQFRFHTDCSRGANSGGRHNSQQHSDSYLEHA